jgi:hypothetical protein
MDLGVGTTGMTAAEAKKARENNQLRDPTANIKYSQPKPPVNPPKKVVRPRPEPVDPEEEVSDE